MSAEININPTVGQFANKFSTIHAFDGHDEMLFHIEESNVVSPQLVEEVIKVSCYLARCPFGELPK